MNPPQAFEMSAYEDNHVFYARTFLRFPALEDKNVFNFGTRVRDSRT